MAGIIAKGPQPSADRVSLECGPRPRLPNLAAARSRALAASISRLRGLASVERWRRDGSPGETAEGGPEAAFAMPENLLLPLLVEKGKTTVPVHDGLKVVEGDVAVLALFGERREAAAAWLGERGWVEEAGEPVDGGGASEPSSP